MAQRIVGLDIGTSAVRAVELTVAEGARPVLEAFGQVGLPHGAIVDGEVRDPNGVAQALRRLWQEGGFREKRVRHRGGWASSNHPRARHAHVPPEELDDAVRFRADDVVPFPMDRTAVSRKVIAQYDGRRRGGDNPSARRCRASRSHQLPRRSRGGRWTATGGHRPQHRRPRPGHRLRGSHLRRRTRSHRLGRGWADACGRPSRRHSSIRTNDRPRWGIDHSINRECPRSTRARC